jgi:glutaminyl-peptide cyclotransferase
MVAHSILLPASVISNGIRLSFIEKALAVAAFSGAFGNSPPAAAAPPTVRPEIVATHPHDPRAFTQGLLLHQGKLYESTGLLGRSSLRRVVVETGAVEKSTSLAADLFGEGLALVSDRLIQLTWQNNVALSYDLEFNALGRFDYTGEGWGLCYDGARLVMSNGSSRLVFRNPTTFAVTGEVEVRGASGPVANLNELECVGSRVYANVWQTNSIVHIDPASGDVLHVVDASGLLSPSEAAGVDVMNGIAFDPASGHFFITGKLWPKLFEVRFSFETGADGGAGGANGSAGRAGSAGSPPASGGNATGPSTGGSPGSEPEAPPPRETRSRGSCGCELPATSPSTPALSLALGIVALAFSRRRRTDG